MSETIRAGRTGTSFELPASVAARLSKPVTKAGRMQRAVLAVYLEHRDDGALPTGGRFLWYELESVVSSTRRRPAAILV